MALSLLLLDLLLEIHKVLQIFAFLNGHDRRTFPPARESKLILLTREKETRKKKVRPQSHLVNYESVDEGFAGVDGALRDGSSAISPRSSVLKYPMPVNDDALGVELVGKLDNDGVACIGSDRRAGELVVDSHNDVFNAVRGPKHVLNLPSMVSDFGALRQSSKPRDQNK